MHRFLLAALGGVFIIAFQALGLTAAADNADILVEECNAQLNLGDSGCACIGDHAQQVLNENQQGLVVAMVTKDQAGAAALRSEMTIEEITGAAEFMMEAPQICASQ